MSHNGGLIPVPGRDLMVQGWYQGGVNVMDFTNPDKPRGARRTSTAAPIDPPPGADVPRHRRPPAQVVAATAARSAVRGARTTGTADLLVGARSRLRHPRADAERPALGERDRRGEAGAGSTSTTRRASRRSSGRRRSRWCARTSTSWCAGTASRPSARRRSPARSTRRRSRAARRVATALNALAKQVDKDVSGREGSGAREDDVGGDQGSREGVEVIVTPEAWATAATTSSRQWPSSASSRASAAISPRYLARFAARGRRTEARRSVAQWSTGTSSDPTVRAWMA